MAQEITCRVIDDESPHDDCRCIEYVRFMANGVSHRAPPERVYEHIVNGDKKFYVEHKYKHIPVIPVENPNGENYIRTAPTDTTEENLLELPSC
jgi:hypothetical protein